jgi:hypothetical protein
MTRQIKSLAVDAAMLILVGLAVFAVAFNILDGGF